MGKQINYYMDYGGFVLLATKAIELGCEIVKETSDGIVRGRSLEIITEDCKWYYFHIPEAGEYKTKNVSGRERIDFGYNASGITLIEANYSFIKPQDKVITRGRLFSITDYYDAFGQVIKRHDAVTKTYDSLARYVKKIAPYTELTDMIISQKADSYLKEVEWKHKEYITEFCLNLRNEGYELGI